MAITCTPKQAAALLPLVNEYLDDPATIPRVQAAAEQLYDWCNASMDRVLQSPDGGFRYRIHHHYGNLRCHDGSQLRGAFVNQLETVFGNHDRRKHVAELLADIIDGTLPGTALENAGILHCDR